MGKRGVRWAALAAITAAGIWGPAAHAAAPPGYTLEWSDEFNEGVGTSPSASYWGYDTGAGGWGNQELETYTNDNTHSHIVSDPNATDGYALQIMATDDNGGVGTSGQYTSARLNTAGNVQPEYGYIEARIQLPYGQGIWPAFWELGADFSSVGWPACGEQDIMENIGNSSWYGINQGSLHGPGYSGGNSLHAQYFLPSGDYFHTAYHTFSELRTPTSVSYFVDGNRYETHTPADTNGNPWAFTGQAFIITNLAVGGDFPGNPDGTTVFPQKMLIDYIRVYSTPYNGPHGIPGVVQAEDFDNGGLNVSYFDASNTNAGGQYRTDLGVGIENTAGGGYDVGYLGAGQWMKYTVDVNATGTYKIAARVAAPAGGGIFHIEDENGNNLTGSIAVPNTGGWQNWSTVNATASLTAGTHTLKFVVDTSGFNIDYMAFTSSSTGAFNGPHNIPGVVQAEDYNQGGEGVGFHSLTTAANPAGVYRNDPITVENRTPAGYDISSTAAGQWLKYDVDVATTGQYNVAFDVASGAASGGTFHVVDENNNNLTGAVTVPNTGGAQNWTNVDAVVNLTAGTHTLQLVEDTGGFSIDQMSFSLGFNGPHNIPGSISAADYDQGGEGLAYHMMSPFSPGTSSYRGSDAVGIEASTPSGYDVGWTQAGQYTNYTVFVGASGTYQAAFSVSSGASGGSFHLQDENGNNLTGSISVGNTGGWQTWTTITRNVTLSAGGHVLQLVQDTGGYNLQGFQFTTNAVPNTVSSISLAPTSVTGGSNSTGTVTLSAPAIASIGPDGHTLLNGQAVLVASDNAAASIGAASNVITVNGTSYVVVTAAQTTATFPVATIGVSTQTTANISASLGGTTVSAPLTITGGGTIPAAPTNLQAIGANAQVTLTWTGSTGAGSYNVYMGTTAGGESITPVASGITGDSALVTNLTNGTKYYFVVKAVNFIGTSVASSEVSATPSSLAPPAPTNLQATAGNGGIGLTWATSTGATSYSIFEGTSAGRESSTPIVSGLTTTNYNVVGLTNGTTYYFYVEAVAQGQSSTPSNEASATPENTAVSAPTNLTAASGSAKIALQWTAATGATSYNVYIGTTPAGEESTPIATNVTGTSYTAAGLTNGTKYYFVVAGVGQAGVGLPSNEASAVPAPPISYPAGLQFISSPLDYSPTDLDTLFGVTDAKIATWLSTADAYAVTPTAPSDKLHIGVGYWVRLANAVTLNGAGVPADSTKNYTITLNQGWNAIGDPFFTSIGQSTFQVNGQPWTQADSGPTPLVATTMWAYNTNSNSYVPAVSIAPEQGYWIYAYSNCTLMIPHP